MLPRARLRMMLYLTSVVITVGCGNLKFLALKGTELENPPSMPIKMYVKEFPVTSKANVVDPNAALGDSDVGGGGR